MRNSYFIVLILLTSFILSCEKTAKEESKDTAYFEDSLAGFYRISSGGGYGIILVIKDSINFDYLQWTDVGGYYSGRNGRYIIEDDSLFLNIYFPLNQDTHYVRIDTFRIEKWNKINIFIPNFIGDEWEVLIDTESKRVLRGSDCFAKVASLNENYLSNIFIKYWEKVVNKNSIPVILPPPPPRPKLVNDEAL